METAQKTKETGICFSCAVVPFLTSFRYRKLKSERVGKVEEKVVDLCERALKATKTDRVKALHLFNRAKDAACREENPASQLALLFFIAKQLQKAGFAVDAKLTYAEAQSGGASI